MQYFFKWNFTDR